MTNRTSTPATTEVSTVIDVSHIRGNVNDEEKRTSLTVFAYFVGSQDNSYGADVGQRLKLVEVNVWDRETPAARAQTVFEVDITKDMCNIFGILHGGCAAYMIDPCSVSSLVVLGRATGADGTGVSQSMNLIWHQPARLGIKLRIVSTSMFINGRIRSARSELWDGDQLCVSATHSTVNPREAKKAEEAKPSKL